jgi:hypothetical protein
VLETEEALELDDPTLRHDAQAITSLFIYLFIYYLFIVLPQDNNIRGRAHPGARTRLAVRSCSLTFTCCSVPVAFFVVKGKQGNTFSSQSPNICVH